MGDDPAPELVMGFNVSFDRSDIEAALSAFAEELETVDPELGKVHGREAFRTYLQTLKQAMPDAQAPVDEFHEAGDTFIVEGRSSVPSPGPLAGADDTAPPGAHVELPFADVLRVVGPGDRLVSHLLRSAQLPNPTRGDE